MPVYKFIEPLGIADLVATGSLKIGTLFGYNDLEDSLRRDEEEGRAQTNVTNFFSNQSTSTLEPFIKIEGSVNFELKSAKLISFVPPMYCFCTSKSLEAAPSSPHAAFKIDDLPGLTEAITQYHHHKLGLKRAIGPIQYAPRTAAFDGNGTLKANPFIKDPRFTAEQEIRCVWTDPITDNDIKGPVDRTPEAKEAWRRRIRSGGLSPFITEPNAEIASFLQRIY